MSPALVTPDWRDRELDLVLAAVTGQWQTVAEVRQRYAGTLGREVQFRLGNLRAAGLVAYREHEGRGQWKRAEK